MRDRRTVDSAFFTGPLRSPARIENWFANESFIDELAAAAGVDPVTYRLRYVGDERLWHVIEVAAKAAGWELRNSPKPASKGDLATGRRIAAMQYEGIDGYARTVCEVEVNKKTGKVRVTRVVAHDVGIIINPRTSRRRSRGTWFTASRSRRRSFSTARPPRAGTGRAIRCSASPSSRRTAERRRRSRRPAPTRRRS
jgi:nicotinate dehydrogenase subunit B